LPTLNPEQRPIVGPHQRSIQPPPQLRLADLTALDLAEHNRTYQDLASVTSPDVVYE